ncbi:MAG: phosphoserine phosphatase SerB [Methylophilaceae bacterium]|jgi:phosphoserine phosphatase|nr:phosphoserine phosphatase SerB [Methylophilaceae bacterium]NCV54074.1 phosphoserine phosphatase SerB [Betaproteobacteria bacterium]
MENYLIYNEELHRFVDENKLSHFDIDIKKIDDKFSSFDSKSNFFIENKKKLISSKTQFFLNINKNIKDFKLLVCDMDSTLIQNECIDEIAELLNLKNEISEITELTMQGKLCFNESIKKRVQLLKGVNICSFEKIVNEKIKFQPHVNEWLNYAKSHNLVTVVVSGGFTYFVNYVKKSLSMDYAFSNTFEVLNNELTGNLVGEIINADKKAELTVKIANQYGIKKNQIIAIGDGANDINMFKESGLSISMHGKPVLDDLVTWSVKKNYYKTILDLFIFLEKE